MNNNVQELLGKTVPCSCGREHAVSTRNITVCSGAIGQLGNIIAELGYHGSALLVADENTFAAAGTQVVAQLEACGIAVRKRVFPQGEMHADERPIGAALMDLDDDTAFIIAVGSGTINDICRFVAKRVGLPYLVVGTAPSMDGYASDVTPVVKGGFKMTFKGVAPQAIIGDTDVLAGAPLNMMAAGFGDVFGKLTARLDWLMANRLIGEYRCGFIAETMDSAVEACIAAAPGLKAGRSDAVEGLMNGLVLSGIAMQMLGDSRPASGAEHHVAHFLEMRDLSRGRHGTLHGDKVGMAALLVMRMYEKYFAGEPVFLPAQSCEEWETGLRQAFGSLSPRILEESNFVHFDPAERQKVLSGITACWEEFRAEAVRLPALRVSGEANLKNAGGPVRPAELGYTRQDIIDALNYAKDVRDKFTILRLAWHSGRLSQLAEEIADEFC